MTMTTKDSNRLEMTHYVRLAEIRSQYVAQSFIKRTPGVIRKPASDTPVNVPTSHQQIRHVHTSFHTYETRADPGTNPTMMIS